MTKISNVEIICKLRENIQKTITPVHDLLCLHAEADTTLFTKYSCTRDVGYSELVVS